VKLSSEVVLLNDNKVTVEFDETEKSRFFSAKFVTAKFTISDDAPSLSTSPS
jgi:hypothetical protein